MIFAKLVSIFTICWGISPMLNATPVGDSCTITAFSQVSHVTSSCNNIIVKSFSVPAKQTLELKLKKGSHLTFEGIITFGVAHWDGPLVKIEGEEVTVKGEKGSKFNGEGAKYWDGKGGPGKPILMRIYGSGNYNSLNLLNCPERCVAISGSNINVDGWNIDVSDGDKHNLGHNTDGFGLSGQYITVTNSVVKNQDDCVVIGGGKNMYIKNVHCYGSHGLSLSVGLSKTSYDGNLVSNITFTECTLTNADNGIHIKTHKDNANGLIQDITYSHITLEGIKRYGAYIQQDYPENDGKPKGNIPIKGLTITDLKGTMHGPNSIPIKVTCAAGACSNWKWSGISIKGNKKPCSMNYHPAGFSC